MITMIILNFAFKKKDTFSVCYGKYCAREQHSLDFRSLFLCRTTLSLTTRSYNTDTQFLLHSELYPVICLTVNSIKQISPNNICYCVTNYLSFFFCWPQSTIRSSNIGIKFHKTVISKFASIKLSWLGQTQPNLQINW